MKAVVDFLRERILEKSTWLGVIALVLGWVGVEATAVQTEQLAGSLTILISTLLMLTPEKKA